jgi:FkbM family methyltransferase
MTCAGEPLTPKAAVRRRPWVLASRAAGHARWAARTAAVLLRRSPDRRATAGLLVRLWWRERRGRREDRLELLRLREGNDLVELWVGDFSDLHVTRETFGDRVYALPAGVRPRTILDLGANLGASVVWFRRCFPDAEIHAVEPDRRSLEKLRRNVGTLLGVTVHHAAVAGEEGERVFYEAQRSWESSLVEKAARGGRPTRVRALTLRGLLRTCVGRERVDLLKMDVEGAEWEVLATERLAERAEVVVGELHAGLLDDVAAESSALRHGLAGLDVRFEGGDGSGHFLALPKPGPGP